MRKRKYLAAIMLLLGVTVFAGCGSKKDEAEKGSDTDNGEKTENSSGDALDFNVEDYVKLGDYKGLKVKYPVPEVSQDDLEFSIEQLLEENTEYKKVSDRAAQEGDSVNIDFTGVIDGEAFEGGTGEDYDVTIGSGEFLEEFENNLVGKNAGEAFTFSVTFPEDYIDPELDEDAAEMNGKTAEFTVTINEISEVIVPEYNDEFVAKVSDYSTTAEYEEYLNADLMISAQEESDSMAGEDALALAVDNAEIDGFPQALYDFFYEETVEGYQFYASLMGMEYEDFIAEMGEDSIEEAALAQTNEYLVVQAIAKQEGLELTEEAYQEEVKALAEEYEYDSVEELEEDYGKESIITQIVRTKVVNFLYEAAELEEVSQEEYYGEDEEMEDSEEDEDSAEIELEEETENSETDGE